MQSNFPSSLSPSILMHPFHFATEELDTNTLITRTQTNVCIVITDHQSSDAWQHITVLFVKFQHFSLVCCSQGVYVNERHVK